MSEETLVPNQHIENIKPYSAGKARTDKKDSMTQDYLTLAYYVCTNALILYLLHKQYKFSALYFLAVFLVILVIIFVLAWFGIPYA